METMQPALKNGRNVWDRINMPVQEFQGRLLAVREKMKEQGMDVLLAYGHGFNDYGNSCYLSNYLMRLPRGTLVSVPREEDVVLFFEGASRGLPSAKMLTWVEDVRPCPDTSQACAEYLKEKNLTPGTIGFAGLKQMMPHYQLKSLMDELSGCDIVDADDIIQTMRMVKSSREADQIRRASSIVKRAFDFASGTPFPTMNEMAIEAMLIREARLEGAEDVRVFFGKPQEAPWALRPSQERDIEPGSVLIVYMAVAYERYWSEGIRTFAVDGISFSSPDLADLEALYKVLTECMQSGKAIAQCYEDIMSEIQKAGIDCIEEYGLGRGIGLSPNEWPLLDENAKGNLEEGMCLTFRLSVRDKARGAVMIGNTLYVSQTGVEILTE